jgi:hypothetical protein
MATDVLVERYRHLLENNGKRADGLQRLLDVLIAAEHPLRVRIFYELLNKTLSPVEFADLMIDPRIKGKERRAARTQLLGSISYHFRDMHDGRFIKKAARRCAAAPCSTTTA